MTISTEDSNAALHSEIMQLRQRIATLEHERIQWQQSALQEGKAATGDDLAVTLQQLHTEVEERRRMEEDVRAFSILFDNVPDGIAIAPIETGLVKYANQAYREMVGYGDTTVGMPFIDFMAEKDRDRMADVLQETLAQGMWTGVLMYQPREGQPFPGQVSAVVLRDNEKKPVALGAIVRDISEQIRAQEERAFMQEQIIQAQKDALRELSTPLIPIAEDVVIMPLIGTIDSGRAQLILETLLEGVANYQATTAVIDITGVPVVDTQVAQALVRTAQAATLLGAQVILTGIQPPIAQTLVHLGVNLGDIVTYGSLQRGVAVVLEQIIRRQSTLEQARS